MRCSQRFHAWLRVLSALALAQFTAAFVLPSLHYVLVEHSVCAEHGELVHAHQEEAVEPAHGEETAVSWNAKKGTHDEHEHCSVGAGLLDRSWLAASPRVLLKAAVSKAPCIVLREVSATASIAVLALAPKQSPPRV